MTNTIRQTCTNTSTQRNVPWLKHTMRRVVGNLHQHGQALEIDRRNTRQLVVLQIQSSVGTCTYKPYTFVHCNKILMPKQSLDMHDCTCSTQEFDKAKHMQHNSTYNNRGRSSKGSTMLVSSLNLSSIWLWIRPHDESGNETTLARQEKYRFAPTQTNTVYPRYSTRFGDWHSNGALTTKLAVERRRPNQFWTEYSVAVEYACETNRQPIQIGK